MRYEHKNVEPKWQKIWEENGVFEAQDNSDKEKFYACLSELFDEFSKEEPSLLIKSLSTTRHVLLSEIEYIEAQNRYTMLYLNNGKSVRTPKPLYAFEDELTLENGFYKCHRSYIINLFRVDSYTSIEITMRSGSKIPLSRSYNTEFKETYFNLVFRKVDE